jgi:pyridinium-3,5-biscarboxylic acid mononucleotide synthase
VDAEELRSLLDNVATGSTTVDDAARELAAAPLTGFIDLGFARLDHHRGMRTGDPEVIYAEGKTADQVITLLTTLHEAPGARPAMATRLTPAMLEQVRDAFPTATIDDTAACVVLGEFPAPRGEVVVLSAGTSDERVAAEAAIVARAFGAGVRRICDVGVAGLHRLLAERDGLADADCLVVVAGMEGALPSVVGGLVGTPIVAVPTSVGYGASFGGIAALLAMLNSCAPGVTVVNIDNGFGAGVFAARVARRSPTPAQPGLPG